MTPFNPHYSEAPQATDTLASAACKTTQARLFTNQCAIALSATRSTFFFFSKKKKNPHGRHHLQFSFRASRKIAENLLACFPPPWPSVSRFTSNSSISVFLLSFPLHLCPLLLSSSPLSALSDPLPAAWVNPSPTQRPGTLDSNESRGGKIWRPVLILLCPAAVAYNFKEKINNFDKHQ